MEAYLGSLHTAQSSSQLNKFRLYLTVARTLDYSISEEVTKVRVNLRLVVPLKSFKVYICVEEKNGSSSRMDAQLS